MKRWFVHAVAVLSLTLAGIVIILAFVCRERWTILMRITTSKHDIRMVSIADRKTFGLYLFRSLDWWHLSDPNPDALLRQQRGADHRLFGFHYYYGPSVITGITSPADPKSTGRAIKWADFVFGAGMPSALLTAMLLAFPIVHLSRCMRQVRRLRAGQCLGCGYDLRATPDRCPECGRRTIALP